MTLKFYIDFLSQPCRTIWLLMKVSKIPFELCPVALRKGEHLQEEFSQIHPFNKVPAIDDGGFKLIESVAIARYLCREKNVPDIWYPKDSKLQAKVDEYLEWQHMNTRAYCSLYFMTTFIKPVMLQQPVSDKVVARRQEEMEDVLEKISKIWLKDGNKPFVVGENATVADLFAVCELEQPVIAGYEVFSKYPILGEYRERVRSAVDPALYDEAHKWAYVTKEKFKQRKANL